MRQLEFNEKLKKAIVSHNQVRHFSPPRRKKNHDTSPLRCVGANKILMKVAAPHQIAKMKQAQYEDIELPPREPPSKTELCNNVWKKGHTFCTPPSPRLLRPG